MHVVGIALDINNAYFHLFSNHAAIILHTQVLLAVVVVLRLRPRLATSLFSVQMSAAPSRWAVVWERETARRGYSSLQDHQSSQTSTRELPIA